ncbi:DUF7010 family protein [Salinibacillus xinjiangensis]|uniref:Uncharacterized protein n=1 Tax=Salinibacillus xinjiangensis TaxID=1229268 RepID=A0A6G1XBM7_9BACI|nr:hypothetical protein [Salinibacillus xinjiangensis]MRG88306.1 hypothetical protein [Salinibacillus xinjiangensis]
MEIDALRNQLSIKSKNGVSFLLAATVIWTIITIIFIFPNEVIQKNIFMLWTVGLMFPLAVLMSKLCKAEWKSNDNPLGVLGLYLNLAQLMYFPIIFWAFANSPEQMILFFAVITGAHFYPYGWFYNAKAYYFGAPIMSVLLVVIGWDLPLDYMWVIPLTMVGFLLILSFSLYKDYQRKKEVSEDLEPDEKNVSKEG